MGITEIVRPRPPAELLELTGRNLFVPAPELLEWIRSAYIDEDGPLYFEGHGHLEHATIGCLWTTAENSRQMRRIVGQAEMPERVHGRSGKWARGRAFQQLGEWFGEVPDFLLTFDAFYADGVDNAAFAALVDHELCHCAQALDEFGMPACYKETGLPKFGIRGHDVNEFVSVVQRFGIEAAGEAAVDMVIAAAQRPAIAPVKLAQACGTCLKVAA